MEIATVHTISAARCMTAVKATVIVFKVAIITAFKPFVAFAEISALRAVATGRVRAGV